MEDYNVKAAIGTMAWGNKLYARIIQGSAVDDKTLSDVIETADKCNMLVLDTAYKYGFGYAEKLLGNIDNKNIIYSAKFTPLGAYKQGGLKKALYRDLKCLHRTYIDIYWLHLPRHIKQNLSEMIELYKSGKIKHIGVSNFNMAEVKLAQKILAENNIPLYGVQNHFSLLSRDWEQNGMLKWCEENGVSFWAWSILEEGALAGKKRIFPWYSFRGILFNKRMKSLSPLFDKLEEIGRAHKLSVAQVSIAWAVSKGIVPVNGCRKSYQVRELSDAVNAQLSPKEITSLERAADKCNIHVDNDAFRFAAENPSR